jgi:uncharacterized protein
MDKVKLAVVTGCHPFDVPSFYNLFRSMPDVDFYPQSLQAYAADKALWDGYDAVVLYNYHQTAPSEEQVKECLEHLGETGQGLVVLHHGLVAFPGWPLWSELVGIPDRRFATHVGQNIRVEVASPDHPITRGLTAWDMVDETYAMSPAGESNDVLLTTEHPQSLRALAWTRQYKQARVFCYQSGHDRQAYQNPDFRTVLAHGIRWTAKRM